MADRKRPAEVIENAFMEIFKALGCPYFPPRDIAGHCYGCPIFNEENDICPVVEVRAYVERHREG